MFFMPSVMLLLDTFWIVVRCRRALRCAVRAAHDWQTQLIDAKKDLEDLGIGEFIVGVYVLVSWMMAEGW